jgi:hypothetical protein
LFRLHEHDEDNDNEILAVSRRLDGAGGENCDGRIKRIMTIQDGTSHASRKRAAASRRTAQTAGAARPAKIEAGKNLAKNKIR